MSNLSPASETSRRRLWRLDGFRRCRLCRRVSLTVLITIILVEAAILIPSVARFERDRLVQIEAIALAAFFGAMDALKPTIDAYVAAENAAQAAERAVMRAPLVGGAIITASGRRFPFGAAGGAGGDDTAGRVTSETHRVVWTPEEHGTAFRVVALLDASTLAEEAKAYILRIAGLVFIISVVVTAATVAVVNAVVLRRVVALGDSLTEATADLDHPERYIRAPKGDDEIATLGRSANELLSRIASQLGDIRRSKVALESLNADLERRVDERTHALAAAEAEARLLARLPEENPNPILRLSNDEQLIYANPHGRQLLSALKLAVGDRAPRDWADVIGAALAGSGECEQTVSCGQRQYSFIFTPVPEAGYVNAYGRDITAERRAEERAARASTHDALTDLPNRALFMHRLEQAVAGAQRSGGGSVLVIGLKSFAEINDALGFEGGDQALIETADRLRAVARTEDEVARIGGDEFGIVAPKLRDAAAVSNLVARVADVLNAPVRAGGRDIQLTAAIGVATYDRSSGDVSADEVVRQAGLALFRAKGASGTTSAFFDPDRDEEARKARAMTAALRAALKDGRFELHYQAKIGLSDGALVGAEALIRMRDEDGGLVSPGAFIPAAERTGLITPIGRWALFESARAFARARRDFGLEAPVAVNLSAVQLAEEDAPALVAEALKDTGLPPEMLELEVTESAVIGDMDRAVAALDDIAAQGVSIAIDDFGTGQSSLSYLRRLPAAKMKLDRSFVVDIETDAEAATVAKAVVGLGRGLDMKTVAEGVETLGQLERLRAIGVDEVQGYLFAKPAPENAFRDLARARAPYLGVLEAAA